MNRCTKRKSYFVTRTCNGVWLFRTMESWRQNHWMTRKRAEALAGENYGVFFRDGKLVAEFRA